MEGADQSTELWLCLCFSPSTPFFLSVFLSVFFSSLLFHQSSSVKNVSREVLAKEAFYLKLIILVVLGLT